MIDSAKVGHDDRHRQGYYQNPAQGADGAENLPGDRLRHHVSIAGGEKWKEKRTLNQMSGKCKRRQILSTDQKQDILV